MNYYFLATALPKLHIGAPPDIGFYEFLNLLHDNMTKSDYEKIAVIRRYYDIQNARSFWKGEELDKWGNLDANELEEALVSGEGFTKEPVSYVFNFLHDYEKVEDRLYHFPKLVADYYKNEILNAEGFLKEFLIFDREWRLILSAFRAKKLKRDLIKELQYEDPDDPFIAQMIAQKDAPTYDPPEKYRTLKTLYEENNERPLELYQALAEWRFEQVREMIGVDMFSVDRVLAYTTQLILIDKWEELDKKKGLQIVDRIVNVHTV